MKLKEVESKYVTLDLQRWKMRILNQKRWEIYEFRGNEEVS